MGKIGNLDTSVFEDMGISEQSMIKGGSTRPSKGSGGGSGGTGGGG